MLKYSNGDFAVLTLLDLSAAFGIRSTTPLCYVDFRQLTVSLALRRSGLPLTFMRENYLYGTEVPVLLHHLCYVEYPKDRSSDRSSSFCTRQTYLDSLKEWICIHIFMRTTHRSMAVSYTHLTLPTNREV